MKWQDALRRGDALADFDTFIGKLRAQAQRQQDDAETLADSKAAVAVKKVLDTIAQNVTLDAKEEEAHARAFGPRDNGA